MVIQNPSKSYFKFEKVILRSLNLIDVQKQVEKLFVSRQLIDHFDPSDLCRAAVVLSVAAMDAYFTDIFIERFNSYLKMKGITDDLVEILNKAGLNTRVALELLSMERPLRRIRSLLEEYLDLRTMQRTEVIDNLFKAYGITNLSSHVEKYKGRKTLIRSIEILVERRNQISHEGDMNSHRKLNPISSKEMKKRIQDIVRFVSGTEAILRRQLI
jgi:hypothetical protein